MNIKRGKFVVIEGLDGCGSSTQVKLLTDYLRVRGIRTFSTKEPTDNVIGGLIRGALTGVYLLPEATMQMLFSADRGHHVKRFIEPVLQSGGWVVCDRYMWSTIAFGGVTLDKEWLLSLQKYFPVPDITFLLEVPPKFCLERIEKDRYDIELYEKLEKLKNVWKNYEWLAARFSDKFFVINGNKSENEVLAEIAGKLEKMIVGKNNLNPKRVKK